MEQGRKKNQEDDVRVQIDSWHSRYKPEQESSDDQQNWVRDLKLARQSGKHGDKDQEQENYGLNRLHSAVGCHERSPGSIAKEYSSRSYGESGIPYYLAQA